MQKGEVQIYISPTGAEIQVKLDNDTVWMDAHLIALLFEVNRPTIVKHIQNIYKSGELEEKSTCSILEQVAADGKKRKMNLYNLDIIISVGYRVNSSQATKFRQWATVRLKDYLVKGYAINEYRLHQKQQEVEFLKTGLRIVSRGIEDAASDKEQEVFRQFAKGLALLDDYDHEALDQKGLTHKKPFIPHTMNIWNSLGRCIPNSSLRYLQNPKTKVFIVPSTKSNKALEKPNYNQA